MVVDSFREFIEVLEQNGQLLRIKEEVPLEPDLGAAGRALSDLGDQAPAALFESLHGFENAKVALNVHGSFANHALMMGMDKNATPREQFVEFVKRYANFPAKMEVRDSAPWQEVVIDDPSKINLFELLPVFRMNTWDGGAYIDKALTISQDPNDPGSFSSQNVGTYRMQVKEGNRLAIQPNPTHDLGVHLKHAEERGEDHWIAIAIGNDPMIEVTASMQIPYGQSEYEMCSALRGKPYPIVHSDFSKVDIPWGSEIVLEGYIKSRYREPEGPFGEFPGTYQGSRVMPIIEVQRISHRKDPIFEALYLGRPWTEIDYMIAVNTCAPIYAELKETFPEVIAVNAFNTHGFVTIVQTKVKAGGFAKAVGLRVLTTKTGRGYSKIVIVVDEDVDCFDMRQVMWALSTRFSPKYDLITIPGLSCSALDPGGEPRGISDKIIMDATVPVAPDVRGHYTTQVGDPVGTDEWTKRIKEMINAK